MVYEMGFDMAREVLQNMRRTASDPAEAPQPKRQKIREVPLSEPTLLWAEGIVEALIEYVNPVCESNAQFT